MYVCVCHLEEAEIRLKIRIGKFICKAFSALNRKLNTRWRVLKSNNYILVWLVLCSARLDNFTMDILRILYLVNNILSLKIGSDNTHSKSDI